jgi:4-coumarate--CoA ligase
MSVTVFEGPSLTHVPPTNLTLPQFLLDGTHPLRPIRSAENPWFIDDITGVSYSSEVTRTRVYGLANSLAARYGVGDNDVVCAFTPNDIGEPDFVDECIVLMHSIDYPIAMWAIHRLGAAIT